MNRTLKTCILLALLSLYALPLRCEDPEAGRKWAIRGGKVVTITKGNLEGAVVLVSGSRIEKVIPRPGADWKLPEGWRQLPAGSLTSDFFAKWCHLPRISSCLEKA